MVAHSSWWAGCLFSWSNVIISPSTRCLVSIIKHFSPPPKKKWGRWMDFEDSILQSNCLGSLGAHTVATGNNLHLPNSFNKLGGEIGSLQVWRLRRWGVVLLMVRGGWNPWGFLGTFFRADEQPMFFFVFVCVWKRKKTVESFCCRKCVVYCRFCPGLVKELY